MSTTPTNQPVPSEKPQDLKFNAGKIDEFVTSMAKQYIDRFGQAHYTIEGLRWVAQQAIAAFGYITLDSFEDGNTLIQPNQVLQLESTGEYYRWDGDFPKAVPSGSTPESTGGIGSGLWLSVGDASLRSDLSKNDGLKLLGSTSVEGLRSIEPSTPNQQIMVNRYNDNDTDCAAAGVFYFHQSDTTSIDDGGIVIVTAGGKRWKRMYVESANVHYFGPRGQSVNDHAPAFNRALAYANARSTESKGTTIYHPDGVYDYTSGTDAVKAPSISIIGESVEGVDIKGAAQELFHWGEDGVTSLYVGAAIKNITIDWQLKSPEATSSGIAIMLQGMSRILIDSIKLRNVPNFITAGKTETNFASNILVSNVRGFQNNCGLPFIDLRFGAGMEIVNSTVFVGGVGHPSFGDTMTTLPGTIAVRGWLGYWDTFQATNCLFERFAVGLSLAPDSGKVYQNFYLVNCIFDYMKGNCFEFDGTGAVTGIKVIGGWGVGWEGYGISIASSLYTNHIEFVSTKILLSGLGAIFYAAQDARNIVFNEVDTIGCNHKNAGGSCASFSGGSKGFRIIGGSYNRSYTGEGMQSQAPIGINIGADCDFYHIDCQDVTGSSASFSIAANSTASKNRMIINNRGQLDSIPVAIGTPGPSVMNKYPFKLLVSVSGSSSGISVNGHPLSGITTTVLSLKPGSTLSCDTTTQYLTAYPE